ncbi:Putative disease resistance protein RGA3 [Triticum urartu]|uniref:Putative disease resistance protein RGA3 n=1 Tax=Triticum urartu TaxID=4572 RepID=M8B139_TRIUA|nr:Putative disease resistance protein RGA3 [Triticum urartu]
MAEDLPLLAGRSAATLALSLLDKAFSHLAGGAEQVYKGELLESVRRILTILDEAERRLVKWRFPSLEISIWEFTRAVDEIEDAVDEIQYHRLEDAAVRRGPVSKLVKRKILARFVPGSGLERLREAVVRLGHMASVVYRYYQRSVARRAPGVAAAAPSPSEHERYPSWIAADVVVGRDKEKGQPGRDKKLLLILDDVWEDEVRGRWEDLLSPIRSAKRGSKILLTTRIQSVADMAATTLGGEFECLKLDGLQDSDNFLLFKSLLNPDVNSQDYANLLLIGEQISKMFGACPFLTLAVVSHLRDDLKTSWTDVLQQHWYQIEGIYSILPSLKLSYDHLPAQLQICFRYCSLFARGHKFYMDKMVDMWVSSGLIPFASREPGDSLPATDNVSLLNPVDVGEEYFTALARKSFFCRMGETDPCGANQKEYYVLHSLLHDLAQLVSRGECARVDNGGFQDVMWTTRHISIANCGILTHERARKISYLRSLRTLIIEIFKLSYLTAKEPDLSDIYNLRCLRSLHIPDNMSSKIHKLGRLTSLQVLRGFEVVQNDGSRLSTLSNLRSLRQLGLMNLQNVQNCREAMEVKLKEKHDMRILLLSWNRYNNDTRVDDQIIGNLEPNREIQILHIHGYNGSVLPFWIANSLLVNLVSLELEYCIKWKSLPSLQELNLLQHLKLQHLFQLEYMGLGLEELTDTNESGIVCLPRFLRSLIIGWCPNLNILRTIPPSLEVLILKHVGFLVLPGIHQRESKTSVKSELTFVHIQSCAHLTSLDKGLLECQEQLGSLSTLIISHCESLRHLPRNGFAALHHLKFLEMVACPLLKDGNTAGNILPISLKNLDINPCGSIDVSMLLSLRNLSFLTKLTLFNCTNLEKLPPAEIFGTLQVLSDLSVARCRGLLSFGGLGAVSSLRMLSILCCDKLNLSDSPQGCCSFMLQELRIDCQALLFVEPLQSLRYTKELYICNDCAMESLAEGWLLQNATSLHSIKIGIAESLQSLPSQMDKLEALQSLHIERAPLMKLLPQLPASLSKLTIWGCDPMFMKRYEKDVGPNWGQVAHIAHVDIMSYSEDHPRGSQMGIWSYGDIIASYRSLLTVWNLELQMGFQAEGYTPRGRIPAAGNLDLKKLRQATYSAQLQTS